MSWKKLKIISIMFFMVLFTGMGKGPVCEEIFRPVHIAVSIMPQAYFVERIGGSRVAVEVMVPPGKSPATYAPTPEQMVGLTKAKLFFRIGVPFEEVLIPKIKTSFRNMSIIDTRKGIHLRRLANSHQHEHIQEHSQHLSGNDPHIWMSPALVKKQAETICEALVRLDPDGMQVYTSNLKNFSDDLDTLHKKIQSALAPLKGSTIFVFHPVFGYFADEYGLKQLAVEIEGKAPKGKNLSDFIKKARKQGVQVVFVQPQFDLRTAQKIADAIQGVVVSVDPLAGNYIENLEQIAIKVAAALKK